MSGEPLRVERPDAQHPGRVAVHGDLDYAHHHELGDVLGELAGEGGDLAVDLTGVTYCDSSGLRVLLLAAQRVEAAGGRFVLRGVSGQPLRALRLTGLDVVLGGDQEGRPTAPC